MSKEKRNIEIDLSSNSNYRYEIWYPKSETTNDCQYGQTLLGMVGIGLEIFSVLNKNNLLKEINGIKITNRALINNMTNPYK